MRLSQRVMSLQPSPTLAIDAKAKALKAAGEKVLSLAAGEPDFPTPEPIRKAAVAAMEAGHTGYAPSAGVPVLREAVRRKYEQEMGLSYGDDQVVVSCGAKHCLFNAFQSLLEAGTEALIQTPYWVSYPEQVRLTGATPVLIPAPARGLGINVEAMAHAVTERTRVVVLNSPNNPTGEVWSGEELDQVAQLCLKHDLTIVSDDIYDKLVYDGQKAEHIVLRVPAVRERTLIVNGVSKAYSMTGWRLGYAVGPRDLIGAMRKVQDQSTSNATTFVQHAAVTALASPPATVQTMLDAFTQRRNRLLELLGAVPGVTCAKPAGAFYVFPNVSAILARRFEGKPVGSALRLAELLLDRERVAVVPGEAFGAPGFLRFSFATSLPVLEEAVARIQHLVGSLS